MNCMGLGARALFDSALVPVRGQLTLLAPQSEIDYMIVAPRDGLYMLPRGDAIIPGTSHERGCWLLAPSAEETARVLDGHRALCNGFAARPARRRA